MLLATLILFACSEDDPGPETATPRVTPSFDLVAAEPQLPSPNNLLFAGSMDGTVNIPVADPANFSDPPVAINALDGFSTIAPITANFDGAIDGASVNAASVRMFEVTLNNTPAQPVGGPVTAVVRELELGTDFAASLSSVDTTNATLAVVPLRALAPSSHYMVALTDSLRDATGRGLRASPTYRVTKGTVPLPANLAALEPVRQLVNAQETALAGAGVDTESVILSWVFSTQSVGAVLSAVRQVVQAGPAPASTLQDSMADSPQGAADIFAGTVSLPYYLATPAGVNDPSALASFWEAQNTVGGERNLTSLNPLPEIKSTQTVPLLASVPKTPKPAGGWPVVIYQHGITTNRATLLAVADSLAAAGFAAVAIDLPLHGLTGNETNATVAFRLAGAERIFDLDLVNNATGAPGPDAVTDTSGTHFIQLTSLLTSRDHLRQGEADLMSLHKALEAMNVDADPGPDFDTNNVHFLGHSLGGMVGGVFLALEPGVGAATLAMSGGGIAKLLDGSQSFGPRIAAGLAANGVNRGTPEYEAFIGAAQTVVDSADLLNYAAQIATGRGVLVFEVVGNGSTELPDQTIPNNVLNVPGVVPSPTAGTDPLVAAMGLT
ncbi:MAG: lipase, partial [Gammaproteobacteria bacterium]